MLVVSHLFTVLYASSLVYEEVLPSGGASVIPERGAALNLALP